MKTIEQIKEELREIIRLAEKAEKGPWKVDHNCVNCVISDEHEIAQVDDDNDASFIAASRTITPLAAKALLLAIEGYEDDLLTGEVYRSTQKLKSIRTLWGEGM